MSGQPPASSDEAQTDRRAPAESSAAAPLRRSALLISNVTKLSGLAVAINETLVHARHDPATLAFAAFMMTGAQISEGVALAFIERFFGTPPK